MSEKIEIEKILTKAKKDESVIAVILFGSYIKSEVKPMSDIDLCLILKENLDDLSMTNKRLEYLNLVSDKFDIHIFQQLPSFIKVRILKEGKILLEKDYETLFKIARDAIREFEFFKPHYYYCIKKIAYG